MAVIGFTGSRRGMTAEQKSRLAYILTEYITLNNSFHHGDCVGADTEAHHIAEQAGYTVFIHPPANAMNRAFCTSAHILPVAPYLTRNKDIVHRCDILVAAPAEDAEMLRSGTWSTIRYARKIGKKHAIILPNGDSDYDPHLFESIK